MIKGSFWSNLILGSIPVLHGFVNIKAACVGSLVQMVYIVSHSVAAVSSRFKHTQLNRLCSVVSTDFIPSSSHIVHISLFLIPMCERFCEFGYSIYMCIIEIFSARA